MSAIGPLTQPPLLPAPKTTTTAKTAPYAAKPSQPLAVETEYGTIRGDIILPDVPAGMKVPVILTYTPYSVLYNSLDPLRESRADDGVAGEGFQIADT